MFAAGSNLKGKSIEEIFYQDFKRFTAGETSFGVGQLIATNRSELGSTAGRYGAFYGKSPGNVIKWI